MNETKVGCLSVKLTTSHYTIQEKQKREDTCNPYQEQEKDIKLLQSKGMS